MDIYISSALVKICDISDCVQIKRGVCLENESFAFQLLLKSDASVSRKVAVSADIPVNVYRVFNKKGNFDSHIKTEDYFIHTPDDMYPELLLKADILEMEKNTTATLFVEIPALGKSAGEYDITISIGEEQVVFPLTVLPQKLIKNDLLTTNWMHLDGICHYYNVAPFSDDFYKRFIPFLSSYVKMGNTMLLIPLFTPPLDTAVGGERLTTQLVKVYKDGKNYTFDFSEVKKYILLAKEYGIEYFEFSHLFTQWGGECAPKIIAIENGEEKRIFGWDTASEDESYLDFLKQFFKAFVPVIEGLGIRERSYLHLTDEPHEKHIHTYERLSAFVRQHSNGLRILDALSCYDFMKKGMVDLPAICMDSQDFALFKNVERLLYYCVYIDKDYLTNRYFHMPLLRTAILGMQLYSENVKGFLHWGYNFYNTQYSKAPVNPYEDASAGGGFVQGDSFVVYPAEDGVNYSIRYFALLKGFEDYRLLKTVEQKLGRNVVENILKNEGIEGIRKYPHEVQWYTEFHEKLYRLLEE